MNGFLVDTNVISEILRPAPDAHVTAWNQRAARPTFTTDEVLVRRMPHVFRFRVRDATPSGRRQRTAHSRQARYSGDPAKPLFFSGWPRSLQPAARRGLQPGRLHFDADDAEGRTD
jgi:hypothetical protein